jgi:hypothetical protein
MNEDIPDQARRPTKLRLAQILDLLSDVGKIDLSRESRPKPSSSAQKLRLVLGPSIEINVVVRRFGGAVLLHRSLLRWQLSQWDEEAPAQRRCPAMRGRAARLQVQKPERKSVFGASRVTVRSVGVCIRVCRTAGVRRGAPAFAIPMMSLSV